jgi:hypothetical protein
MFVTAREARPAAAIQLDCFVAALLALTAHGASMAEVNPPRGAAFPALFRVS